MCGIIGLVKNDGNAAQEVFCGLKRLEYRGYDSVGIATLNGGEISCYKRDGRVEGLKDAAAILKGSVALGHTRWATHGEPSARNAHPHVCGKFAVVHNGIIENFFELKEELINDGESFFSQTDSEVAAKLLNKYYKENGGDLLSAVASCVKRLKGSFALGIICSDFNGIVAVKYKSPVVIGAAENRFYIASDMPALPQTVKSVYLPEDGSIAVLNAQSARFYDFGLKEVKCVNQSISLGQCEVEKGNYPHFMIKEIFETPSAVRETCDAFFRFADLNKLKNLISSAEEIIFTGCGTAYNAGLLGKRFFEACGLRCSAEIASELRYYPPAVGKKTLAVAISQSGETADTLEAAKLLKERGATVIAVTNCGYSAITRVAHVVVPVCAGAEICVAATKSYVGQVAALYLLSRLNRNVYGARAELEQTAEKIKKVLENDKISQTVAEVCAKSRAVFFLGRGADYDCAVEASLKLKEVSYVFSDAYPAGELKHGTLALVDEGTLGVFIICDERVADKCENAVEQVLSRKGKAVVITNMEKVESNLKDKALVWRIPRTVPQLSPVLSGVALQTLAYKTAVLLDRDPDKPRNLAKSVTVE